MPNADPLSLFVSFPRKRESRASDEAALLDPRFRGGDSLKEAPGNASQTRSRLRLPLTRAILTATPAKEKY